MELDLTNITEREIEFYNLTSVGSRFLDVNETYNASLDFYGLAPGLVIRNINLSTDLFESTFIIQNYEANFSSLQILKIMGELTRVCSSLERNSLYIALGLLAIAIFLIAASMIFGEDSEYDDPQTITKKVVPAAIVLIVAVVAIKIIADNITAYCA